MVFFYIFFIFTTNVNRYGHDFMECTQFGKGIDESQMAINSHCTE